MKPSGTNLENWDLRCVVCDKSVQAGGGYCHINVQDRMIALCCPLCLETFQKDPAPYLRRRESNILTDELRNSS